MRCPYCGMENGNNQWCANCGYMLWEDYSYYYPEYQQNYAVPMWEEQIYEEEEYFEPAEYYYMVWKNHLHILLLGLLAGVVALVVSMAGYGVDFYDALLILLGVSCGICAIANLLNRNTGMPSMFLANIIIGIFNVFIHMFFATFEVLFSNIFGIALFVFMAAIDLIILVVCIWALVIILAISAAIYLIECIYYFVEYNKYCI